VASRKGAIWARVRRASHRSSWCWASRASSALPLRSHASIQPLPVARTRRTAASTSGVARPALDRRRSGPDACGSSRCSARGRRGARDRVCRAGAIDGAKRRHSVAPAVRAAPTWPFSEPTWPTFTCFRALRCQEWPQFWAALPAITREHPLGPGLFRIWKLQKPRDCRRCQGCRRALPAIARE